MSAGVMIGSGDRPGTIRTPGTPCAARFILAHDIPENNAVI